jgi:signal transduction histidine kinase
VGHILKAGRHLLALINDVLDLSRIEAGTLTISLEPVDAGELIGDAVALIQPAADSRSIRLKVGDAGCDVYVQTDRQRCRQILLNLLSNAVKFTEAGEVRLSVEHRPGGSDDEPAPPREAVVVHVSDSGPGIDLEDRARIFEPFVQLDSGLSRRYGGTGLGLYLSAQYAGLIGGVVEVTSEIGKGSTFSLVLPCAAAVTRESPQSLTPAVETGSGLRR